MIIKCASLCKKTYDEGRDWLYCGDDMTDIIAIRGSVTLQDWHRNFKFLFQRDSCHRGFGELASTIYKNIKFILPDFPKLDKNLILTGHSMGGSVATIIASYLGNIHPHLSIVTFGAPRPGGRGLKFRMRNIKQQFRFVMGEDPVPWTPPWLCGYVHTSSLIYLPDPDGKVMNHAEDHNIERYMEALERRYEFKLQG